MPVFSQPFTFLIKMRWKINQSKFVPFSSDEWKWCAIKELLLQDKSSHWSDNYVKWVVRFHVGSYRKSLTLRKSIYWTAFSNMLSTSWWMSPNRKSDLGMETGDKSKWASYLEKNTWHRWQDQYVSSARATEA